MMDSSKDTNIMIMKSEAVALLQKGLNFLADKELGKACIYLKQAIDKAERLYHITYQEIDKELLIKCYNQTAKYYYRVYEVTGDVSDLQPSILYYEKVIAFYEDDLSKNEKELLIKELPNLLEAYVQILWLSFTLSNERLYKKYIDKCFRKAKKLLKLNNTYENEQYLILCYVFEGDYYRGYQKNELAYFNYIKASKRLETIYANYPKEGIKNDLIVLYTNLSKICLILKLYNKRQKFEQRLKELSKIENNMEEDLDE